MRALFVIATAMLSSTGFGQTTDRCKPSSTPVLCYEAELRSIGVERGKIERDRAELKAEIAALKKELEGSLKRNPAHRFLEGVWCDGKDPALQMSSYALTIGGKDILLQRNPDGATTVLDISYSGAGKWILRSQIHFPLLPQPSLIVTTLTKVSETEISATTSLTHQPPFPPGTPPPTNIESKATAVRC